MNDIKIFTENETRSPDTNNKNIQPGYRSGIWHRKMWNTENKKLKRETMKRIELPYQESI